MNRYVGLVIMLVVTAFLVGCSEQIGDYTAASSISENGFARDEKQVRELEGQQVRIWGFVDQANMYGDAGAKEILGDWWSGDGPDATTWRFNLKAKEKDEAGQSFAVQIPNDEGRDDLLRLFLDGARAGIPTKVFVTGRIYTFDAPTNAVSRTGLYMELQSSGNIQLELSEAK
jgi:hypothetical protein